MLGELIKATPLKKNKDKNISTTVYSSLESLKNDSLSVYQFFDVTIVTALSFTSLMKRLLGPLSHVMVALHSRISS